MNTIAMLDFVDIDSGANGHAYVRASSDLIGLTLSLQSNGDIEVFLRPPDCERLIAALQAALIVAGTTAADDTTTQPQ